MFSLAALCGEGQHLAAFFIYPLTKEVSMFTAYRNPTEVGWLGWFEDSQGKCTAFVGLDLQVVFMAGLK